MKSATATATAILRSDVKWIPLQVVRKIQELMPALRGRSWPVLRGSRATYSRTLS